MNRRLYTREQAAEQLSIGMTKMKELLAAGEMRTVAVGRSRRVIAESIDEYVRKLDAQQNRARKTA